VLPLCSSYRFGGAIADAGNLFLDAMGAEYRLVGMGSPGRTTYTEDTTTVLFRSNIKMIMEILSSQKQDTSRKIHVVGGTKEMVSVLYDLSNLYFSKSVKAGELAGFADWGELKGLHRDATWIVVCATGQPGRKIARFGEWHHLGTEAERTSSL
ncbi:MAG: hypothetical protein HKL81_02455, partial [Acidimicrobiaceae bacterium]|nr:hypothetical protein [Acidimicrobiaceae bacterium]